MEWTTYIMVFLLVAYYSTMAAGRKRRECFNKAFPTTDPTNIFRLSDKSIDRTKYKFPPVLREADHLEYYISGQHETIERDCSVKGTPKPTVRWFKNGHELQDTRKITIKRGILQIRDLAYDDDGHYHCIAENDCGRVEWKFEQNVVVRIINNVPPLLVMDPKNQTVMEGEDVIISCPCLSDSPVTIWWRKRTFKDGKWEITNLPKNFQKPFTIELHDVTENDTGLYECILENEHPPAAVQIQALTVNRTVHIAPLIEDNSDTMPVVWISVAAGIIVMVIIAALIVVCLRQKKQRRPMAKETALNPIYPLIMPVEMKIIPYDMRWEFSRDNLQLGDVIGEGFFGKVYKGVAIGLFGKMEPAIVAVKTLKENATVRELDTLVQEMNVMKSIGDHPNIINFVGCCTQDGPLFMMLEYAINGNLRDFLQSRKPADHPSYNNNSGEYEKPQKYVKQPNNTPLTCRDLVSFAYQVSRGMEYLSSKNIIHRDLAARNILVAEDNILKIADFGLTRDLKEREYYTKQTETPLPIKWLAIECLRDKKFLPKSDVWSFGVLMWEIFSYGGSPYPALDLSVPDSLYRWLAQGNRMDRPKHSPTEVYTLMLKCWREEVSERPSFEQLVSVLDSIVSDTTGIEYLSLTNDVDYFTPKDDTDSDYYSPKDEEDDDDEEEEDEKNRANLKRIIDPILEEEDLEEEDSVFDDELKLSSSDEHKFCKLPSSRHYDSQYSSLSRSMKSIQSEQDSLTSSGHSSVD